MAPQSSSECIGKLTKLMKNYISGLNLSIKIVVCVIISFDIDYILENDAKAVILKFYMLSLTTEVSLNSAKNWFIAIFETIFTGVFTLFSYSLIIHVIIRIEGYKKIKSQNFSNILGPGTEWFICKKSQNVPTLTDDIAPLQHFWMDLLMKTFRLGRE